MWFKLAVALIPLLLNWVRLGLAKGEQDERLDALSAELERTRLALEAVAKRRRADSTHPDGIMRNDGFRRD